MLENQISHIFCPTNQCTFHYVFISYKYHNSTFDIPAYICVINMFIVIKRTYLYVSVTSVLIPTPYIKSVYYVCQNNINFVKCVLNMYIDIQTSKELIQINPNKMMINEIFTMDDENSHSQN